MKHGYLLICFALCFGLTNMSAQSLVVFDIDSIALGTVDDFEIVGHAKVTNTSDSTIVGAVRRIDEGYNDLTDLNAFCWLQCYGPNDSVSPTYITLEPGDTTTNFSGHVYPDIGAQPMEGSIDYVFFDLNNPSDSTLITIRYVARAGATSVKDVETSAVKLFPNPTTGLVNFDIDVNITVCEIYQVNGSLLKHNQIQNNSMDVSDLSSGFYIVKATDGKQWYTSKLIKD